LARKPLVPPATPPTDGEIILRLRRPEDVPLIAEASRDPETIRRLEDEPMTPERERSSIARVEEQWRTGAAAPFVVADARDDRAVGLVNLQFGEDATLAVSVFPQERGRGIASRALRLAATWGLRDLGLREVVAEAAADNTASIRAIEKAGFRRVGLRDDQVRFCLLPEDVGPP
jgi:RimJ/RimL family protein N-acetyltransferase